MSGFKMGVVYRESEIFGMGLYSVLGHGRELKNPKDASDTLKIQIKMEYLTLFYHHIVFKKRFLEFQLPFELGLGSSHFTFLSKKNSRVTKEKHIPVVPYGLGMKFIFKPVPHAGIFLYLGYLSTLKSYKYPVPLKGLFSSLGLYVNVLKINRDTRYYLFKKKRFRRDVKKCVVK
jgi:hypothetical protein